MTLLYSDLVKAQTNPDGTPFSREQIAQAATLPAPTPTPTPTPTAALPPLTPQSSGAPNQPTSSPSGDPLTVFNTKLMEMLKQSQSQSNAPLYNRANQLDTTQTTNSMAPAADLGIGNLAPGDALAARKSAAGEYNPEVKSLNNRIALNNENISKFEAAVKAAKDFGDGYDKYVKADDATVQAVKQQMAAGFLPSATVLDKVGKFLTADDWNALSTAKNKTDSPPNSYQEYSLTTKNPTPEGYATFLKGSGSGSGGGTVTERLLSKQGSIIDKIKALPKGTDGKVNPDDYLNLASEYVQANGNVADFVVAAPPAKYLTPGNATYVNSVLKPASGRSL